MLLLYETNKGIKLTSDLKLSRFTVKKYVSEGVFVALQVYCPYHYCKQH